MDLGGCMENKRPFGYVEKSWRFYGLHCMVIFTRNGVRNGYIGIPKTHKLYGVRYDQKCEFLKLDNCKKFNGNVIRWMCADTSDGMLSPDMYFQAHCGFTYSDYGKEMPKYYNADEDLWYFGFDCNHCDDVQDWKLALKYNLISLDEYKYHQSSQFRINNPIRTLEYCENNINEVIYELIKFK